MNFFDYTKKTRYLLNFANLNPVITIIFGIVGCSDPCIYWGIFEPPTLET